MPLIHEFRRTGQTTRIIDGSTSRLTEYQDNSSIDGGPTGASGTISLAEYTPRTGLYTDGSTWLVKDSVTSEYIWGGTLRDPEQPGGGVVKLVADGFGKMADRAAKTFFVQSYDLSQWSAGDEDPFTQNGSEKLEGNLGGSRIRFKVAAHSHFRRNDAGNPSRWENGFYRWFPDADVRRIDFNIDKSKGAADYFFEVVALANPTAPGNVIGTFGLADADPESVGINIAAGYNAVGIRCVRTTQTKHAPKRRFTAHNIRIGGLTQTGNYTLKQAFDELATRMNVGNAVSASSINIAPFETDSGTHGQILDELSIHGPWFWRIEPNPSTGTAQLQAGPFGKSTWRLTRTNSPVNLIPEERFNQVRVPYRKGGLTFHKNVTASPNPFPAGVFRTYQMEWEEPPHEQVADAFALTTANMLAAHRTSGDASFTHVETGGGGGAEVHGTKVQPGDQLVLGNHGAITCTVDDVSHDPDGAVTNVHFMTGNAILDKMLARRQRLLNKGLNPDRATMGALDPEEPKPPTNVVIGFRETQRKGGRRDFDMIVTWNPVTEDIDGNGTYVNRAIVKFRPTDAGGTPIADVDGGGWREKRIRNTKDTESDVIETPHRAHIEKVPHPHLWKWEVKVAVIDLLGQRSEYTTSATKEKPANFGPPVPTSLTIDVDSQYVHVAWDVTTEPSDAELPHQGVSYSQAQFDDAATFATLVKNDKHVRGESKTWRFKKPLDGTTYWARVRNVDTWGNKSAWVTTSGSTKAPPTPGIDSSNDTDGNSKTRFDSKGTRKGRWRVVVVPTTVSYADEDIDSYQVRMVHHATAGASPPAGSRRFNQSINADATGDDLSAVFKGIPRNHTVWVRVRAKDRGSRPSPFSSWVRLGTPRNPIAPYDAVKDAAPATPSGVTVDKTHPRVIRAKWTDTMGADEDVDHYIVRVHKSGVLQREVRTRRNEYTYHVPRPDRDSPHRVRVYAADDLEQESSTFADEGADTFPQEILTAADLGSFIEPAAGHAALGSEWLVPGTMTLSLSTGAFRTSATGNRVELSKVEGADRVTFIPSTGSKTVLESGSDGVRWGGPSSTVFSRLRQDATLQLGETVAGTVINQACMLYMRDQGTVDQLVVKFGRTGNVRVIAAS